MKDRWFLLCFSLIFFFSSGPFSSAVVSFIAADVSAFILWFFVLYDVAVFVHPNPWDLVTFGLWCQSRKLLNLLFDDVAVDVFVSMIAYIVYVPLMLILRRAGFVDVDAFIFM